MINVVIKSKCYYPITTVIDGKTVKIPSKGRYLKLKMTKITDHLEELQDKNLIQIVKK